MSDTTTESMTPEAAPTAYDVARDERAAEVESNKETDASLRSIWDRMNGPEAHQKEFMANPPMPPSMVSDDRAQIEWFKMSLEDKQVTALAEKQNADLREAAKALGLEINGAADLEAVKRMIAGETGIQPRPAIDKETQASLETFSRIVPGAKSHAEASQFLNSLADRVAQDPVEGAHAILQSLGLTVADLLTPEHLAILAGQAQQHQDVGVRSDGELAAWQRLRGVSEADLGPMLDYIQEGKYVPKPGETFTQKLDRVHALAQRSRPSKRVAQDRDMDTDLRGVAARRYGGEQ
jgi:hypothetical protein